MRSFDLEFWKTVSEYMNFRYNFVKDFNVPGGNMQVIKITRQRVIPTLLIDIAFDTVEDIGSQYNLPPIYQNSYEILYVKNSNYSPYYFLSVFNLSLWLGIVIIISSIFIFSSFYSKMKYEKFSKTMMLFFQFMALSYENISWASISLKISSVTISLFSFMIAAAFSGFLSAQVAISHNIYPFLTWDDFIMQDIYKLCASLTVEKFNWFTDKYVNSTNLFHPECLKVYYPNVDYELQVLNNICTESTFTYILSEERWLEKSFYDKFKYVSVTL